MMARIVDNLDEITARQRKLSPRFPPADVMRERLHKRNEAIVARGFLAVLASSFVIWYLSGGLSALPVAVVGVVGFFATCYYAGSRQQDRQERGV